jgi:hypothetical protein
MFGRIFGRGKGETDQAVCAQCGRTLLVGEWTQNVVGADGEEYLICSLCGQSTTFTDAEPVAIGTTPANNGRVRESRSEVPAAPDQEPAPADELYVAPAAAAYQAAAAADQATDKRDSRSESDAFWRALKEKDAEIERLQALLARSEAEKQELAGQLATARALSGVEPMGQVPREPLEPAAAAEAAHLTGDSSEPGERTWGETPAEFAAELAALRDEETALQGPPEQPDDVPTAAPAFAAAAVVAAVDTPEGPQQALEVGPEPSAEGVPAIVFEATQPIPELTDEMIAEDAAAGAPLDEEHEAETTLTPEPQDAAEAAAAAVPVEEAPPEPTQAELEAEAASLTLLQRGVDLLNVSQVPHKIADTSEQLGLPLVHVGFDGQTTAVTFMWSMGWYRFKVDAESGAVGMAERGYDEPGLRPNAGVRADGTVQLAPAQISRAAAQRTPSGPEAEVQPQAAPAAAPTSAAAEPEPPSVAAQKAPEILSKSLLGQRSDDDAASWEQTQARDFDWNR